MRRRSIGAGSSRVSTPSIQTLPAVGSISRFTIRSVVVLPRARAADQHKQLAGLDAQRHAVHCVRSP